MDNIFIDYPRYNPIVRLCLIRPGNDKKGKVISLSAPKRIGIIGSRRRDERADFRKTREAFKKVYSKGDWVISGGCPRGGDAFAESLAKEVGCPIVIFYPNWKEEGRVAGFNRNTTIAENSDIIIACVAPDRSGGTEDTLKKFKRLGHPDNDIIIV